MNEIAYLGTIVEVGNKTAIMKKDDPERTNAIINGTPIFRFQFGNYVTIRFPYSQKTTHYSIVEEKLKTCKLGFCEWEGDSIAVVGSEVYLDE